jgi:ATP-binding cassette subfamily B (MDR/TAP) protein 1
VGQRNPLFSILSSQLVDSLNSVSCNTSTDAGPLPIFGTELRTKALDVIYIVIANFLHIYTYTSEWSLFSKRLVRRLRLCYLTPLLRTHDEAFLEALPAGEVACYLAASLQAIQSGTAEKVGLFISSV